MSDWAYVAIAYTVVWGSVAVYALLLARRVAQAREIAQALRDQLGDERVPVAGEGPETGHA